MLWPSLRGKTFRRRGAETIKFYGNSSTGKKSCQEKRPHLQMQMWSGTPEGTRTPDLTVRSRALYPAELQAHIKLSVLTA